MSWDLNKGSIPFIIIIIIIIAFVAHNVHLLRF